MSEMVERVARAICVARKWSPENWDLAAREARAAIAAMRVPTEAMMFDYDVDITWKRMIDEALR